MIKRISVVETNGVNTLHDGHLRDFEREQHILDDQPQVDYLSSCDDERYRCSFGAHQSWRQ